MAMPVELKARRWLARRVERQMRRRLRPPARPRLVTVVSLVDGYCEILGPAGNDDARTARRTAGPPLALVRG